jgi:hypothetical protein
MTNEHIALLRRLHGEGTPAPWLPYSRRDGEREAMIRAAGGVLFVGVDDGEHPELNTGIDADTCLATAARNALPKLLDEREALLKALKDARGALAIGGREDAVRAAITAIAKAEVP